MRAVGRVFYQSHQQEAAEISHRLACGLGVPHGLREGHRDGTDRVGEQTEHVGTPTADRPGDSQFSDSRRGFANEADVSALL